MVLLLFGEMGWEKEEIEVEVGAEEGWVEVGQEEGRRRLRKKWRVGRKRGKREEDREVVLVERLWL